MAIGDAKKYFIYFIVEYKIYFGEVKTDWKEGNVLFNDILNTF